MKTMKPRLIFLDREPPAWLRLKALTETGVVIFGAGAGGHMLHEFFSRTDVPVKAFLDNYQAGRVRLGRPILPGTAGPDLAGLPPETPVIISVFNFSAYGRDDAEAVRGRLKESGWQNVASRPECLSALFFDHQEEIERVESLWADEKSRILYRRVLNYFSSRAAEHEPPVQPRQYFASDVPAPAGALRWVQGGAYTGDTLTEALGLGLKIEEAAFFEPDLVNFRRLAATVRAYYGGGGRSQPRLLALRFVGKSGGFAVQFRAGCRQRGGPGW
jgi:hypothetical protein